MKPRLAAAAAILFAFAACGHGGNSGPGTRATAARPPGLDCHGDSTVWELGRKDEYVLSGDRRYGTSKRGKYVCLSDARARGLHQAAASSARGHHRHRHRRRSDPFST